MRAERLDPIPNRLLYLGGMKRLMRNPWLVAVGGVAILALGSLISQWLGFDANTIAAMAGALAAIAALAAAVSSSDAARESTRALAYATKPELKVSRRHHQLNDNPARTIIDVEVVGQFDMSRATVSWRFKEGASGSAQLGRVLGIGAGTSSALRKAEIDVGLAPKVDARGMPTPGVDRIVVDYWGSQGGHGWRQIKEWYTEASQVNGRQTVGHGLRLLSDTALDT